MRSFDPRQVAYYEKENWVAYYNKNWLRLLYVSVSMVRAAFGLSLFQAIYAAYLVARAEMAAAPYPVNDIPRAEAYMRRFYAFVSRIHHESLDVPRVAKLEVNWWVVHRQLFGVEANQPVADALTALYAAAYRVAPERVRDAAAHRAKAMVYSDRWVNEGRVPASPLLESEEQELFFSYASLRDAIQISE
jgi:hypothetical protein